MIVYESKDYIIIERVDKNDYTKRYMLLAVVQDLPQEFVREIMDAEDQRKEAMREVVRKVDEGMKGCETI